MEFCELRPTNEHFFVALGKRTTMDVFSATEIGSVEAIQGRGNTAGTSTRTIYLVSKLLKGQFQPGRALGAPC